MTARWYLIENVSKSTHPISIDLVLAGEFKVLASLPIEDVAIYDNPEVAKKVQELFNDNL